ncbi:MAG: prolipoprotein diacylglyceryl transferase [Clostridia bacterium]|nr:prolipoprotein diacylglyceryl transferase [Clostridia bacterium]MBQ7046149.1 prolipoprotein diacylglyceryl transferase [Oscillospiraceae bacterium]
MYPYIEIFGINISSYFMAIVVGLTLTIVVGLLRSRAERFHTSTEDVFFTIMCILVGVVIGAKVFQIIGRIIQYGSRPDFWTIENWKSMIPGVGVLYGGMIGGFIAALLYVRFSKLDFWDLADILTPAIIFSVVSGRIGCFMAGCCYGIEASWGVVFTNSAIAPNGVPLVPVQLFESGFNLLVTMAMLIIRPERKRKGILLPTYFIVYAVGRFILEFFRGDMNRGVYLLSTSQWISLLILPLGILMLTQAMRTNATEKVANKEEKHRI